MALKDIRLKRGWSQVTLSKRSGVTTQTINDIEHGANRNPSWEKVARLAHVLGCDPQEICSVVLPSIDADGLPTDAELAS